MSGHPLAKTSSVTLGAPIYSRQHRMFLYLALFDRLYHIRIVFSGRHNFAFSFL